MPWAAAIGAAGSLGSSLIAAGAESSARENANRLIQQSVDDLKAVGIPTEEAMKISLERYRSAGILTPEMEQDILQGRTEMEGISTDPRLQEAEMAALNELRGVGESGGLRASDRARLEETMGNISAQERGSREAILQDAAQRGNLSGGATLAAQLSNQQEAARRANVAGLQTAGQAQDAALQAIIESGRLAGNIQSKQFGQQAQIKSAQDVINQMNTQARQGVQQRNVGSRNIAQERNLASAQDIMNQNVGVSNQEQMYNKSLPQQRFENEMNRAGALGNVRSGQANNMIQGGQRAADRWTGIGQAVGQAGTQYYKDEMNAAEREKDRQAKIRTA